MCVKVLVIVFRTNTVQRWGIHLVHSCTTGDNSFHSPPLSRNKTKFCRASVSNLWKHSSKKVQKFKIIIRW